VTPVFVPALTPAFAGAAPACRWAITHSAALRLRPEEPPAGPPRNPSATAFAAAPLDAAVAAPDGAALRARDPVAGSAAAARCGVPEGFEAFVGLADTFLAAAIWVFLLANDCGHVSARRLRDPAWTLEAGEPG
jgi:hypothetical protein